MSQSDAEAAPPVPAEEEIDALSQAAQVLVGITAQSIARVEEIMTLPQWRLLIVVATRDEINATSAAQLMGVHPSNITRSCDRLVDAGFLDRHDSPADRRHLSLALTDKGQALVASITESRRAAIGQLLAQIPPASRRGLVRAMQSIGAATGEPLATDAWFPRPPPAARSTGGWAPGGRPAGMLPGRGPG
ncbi:MAG: MarR family winged helix-turn-helix transcriptional regulator [Actinomycetota bacterium]